MWIKDSRRFSELVKELKGLGSFALDTEFIREKTFRPRLCLLQVATRSKAVLVDPVLVGDLVPFVEILRDPEVEKVVHSGEQDMEIFYSLGRMPPRNIVDVQVAAALVGLGDSVSYGRLVEELAGVKLRKVETYSDWSKRPLSREQVEYALDDVKYLYPVLDALRGKLRELGRLEWLADELQFYERSSSYERSADEAYKKVRSASRLESKELAVLKELAAWREEEAEKLDRPRNRVIQDETLVDIARRVPKTVASLAAIRGVHPQLVKRSGKEILHRTARALQADPSTYPAAIDRPFEAPELSLVVDLLEVTLKVKAAEKAIAPGYLGSRRDLLDLARRELLGEKPADGAPSPLLSGWRKDVAGDALIHLLHGDCHVAVDRRLPGVRVIDRKD
jgi:ribonuclease D